MLEEKNHELQETVGEDDQLKTTEEKNQQEKTPAADSSNKEGESKATSQEELATEADTTEAGGGSTGSSTQVDTAPGVASSNPEDETKTSSSQEEMEDQKDVHGEIDADNAEDAEDTDNHRRHHIPMQDYHAMSMENLVGELQQLVKNEKVQAIKKHVESIKSEFDLKYQEFIEEKKDEFLSKGGNEIDFRYTSVTKRQFHEVYSEYKEKKNQYYKNLEQRLKENLKTRLDIIEELKALVNVEEDINTTYKNFKDLQERWKSAGPVPRSNYNDVWRTYHHHLEIFYDFLHLNRELRDLDFKHNLEEKTRLVERAEALLQEPDIHKAFRELQTLHKIWKEDIGPVAKEKREEIWGRFSLATKAMHQRRQEFHRDQEKVYEKNLEIKEGIISEIAAITDNIASNHRALQQQIKEVEALREKFFKAGKVPQKVNEATWSKFKDTVRRFNRNKNAYYKNLKKEQQQNLDKKRELLATAKELKDSEDWDSATPEFKRIQQEWKKVGHVPRKYSDAIWKDFKAACNHYFDRLHARKNKAHKAESENYEKKAEVLTELKAFELSGDKEKDLDRLKEIISAWKSHGRVPFNKKSITAKYNKILDALFRKLGLTRQEAELLKYGNKIQQLAKSDDDDAFYKERSFIRKKISDSKDEIRQLENNLQFFSGATEDNPLVQEVVQKIERHKEALETWNSKLKKLNILHNDRLRAAAEETEEDDSEE